MERIIIDCITKSFTSQSTDILIDHEKRPVKTRTVLKDFSLEIPVGKLTVIVGRSGCGKSTLLKLLNGQQTPDRGEIRLPNGWHTALLSPDPYVITWTNVLQNIALAGGAGRNPEERLELAQKLVRLVRLEDYADLTPPELSTGMRQRLGIARLLASQAQILLMDEPFASLDFITRAELQNELLAIQKRMPRTIVLVTHQLEEALLLGQRIIVMKNDGHTVTFDLEQQPYPRDPDTPELRKLKEAITLACKS